MKTRVLVVDDSPFIHKAIARVLPVDSFEICGIGKNGQEGVELYQSLTPDIVTMDVTMPIMNGLDAAKEILKKDPKAKIIMLSAMGDEEMVRDAQAVGIKMLLQKPFKADEMLAALNKVLAMDQGTEEAGASGQDDDDYFTCFRSALQDNLKTMTDLDCTFGAVMTQEGIVESKGLTVIVGITGNMSGRVILDTSKEVACKLCGIMNGEEYNQEDEYILFSLAELLNILSGNAISMLNNKHKGLSLRICPPSVFVGQRLNINSPKVKVKIVKAHTDAGDVYLSVGFEGGR